jgi:hypothetical protein
VKGVKGPGARAKTEKDRAGGQVPLQPWTCNGSSTRALELPASPHLLMLLSAAVQVATMQSTHHHGGQPAEYQVSRFASFARFAHQMEGGVLRSSGSTTHIAGPAHTESSWLRYWSPKTDVKGGPLVLMSSSRPPQDFRMIGLSR